MWPNSGIVCLNGLKKLIYDAELRHSTARSCRVLQCSPDYHAIDLFHKLLGQRGSIVVSVMHMLFRNYACQYVQNDLVFGVSNALE